MSYTAEQYEMLERFERGANISNFSEKELDVYRFLDSNKLLNAHADVEDGLFDLSQLGKCVLEEHREKVLKDKKETEQAAKDKASKKNERIKESAFQVFLLIFGFVLGLASDHFSAISKFFMETIKPWFASLFH